MRRTSKSKTCVWRWRASPKRATTVCCATRHGHRASRRLARRWPRVVALTLSDPPAEATHWVAAMMAKATGISVSSVQRIWRARRASAPSGPIQAFERSRLRRQTARCGRALRRPAGPRHRAVDEKSQIQALDRTQPGLPMKKGRLGIMTTTSGMGPCSPPSTFEGKVPCSATATRSSSASSTPSADMQGRPRQLRRPQACQGARLARPPRASCRPPAPGSPRGSRSSRRRETGVRSSTSGPSTASRRTNDNPNALHLDRRSRHNHRRRRASAEWTLCVRVWAPC